MPTSAYVTIALWACGLLYLAARTLNFLRLVLNNLKSGQIYLGVGFTGPLASRFTINAAATSAMRGISEAATSVWRSSGGRRRTR